MYDDGEALILALVRTVTNFSSANTSQGDWSILNTGNSVRYAILTPGPFTRNEQGGLYMESHWSTVIEVWHRYIDDDTTGTGLQADITAILNMIDKTRHLADTTGQVRDATARRGDVHKRAWAKSGNGPLWLVSSITVTWDEEEPIFALTLGGEILTLGEDVIMGVS